MTRRVPLVVAFAAALMSCGYVGDPLPPAFNIVKPVADLRLEEVGDKLQVAFTLPPETTEGLDWRKIGGVEFRIGPVPQPFDQNAWLQTAKLIPLDADSPGGVKREIASSQWDKNWYGQEVAAAVRARNLKGRLSQWSNFATLRIVAPMVPPVDAKASSNLKGVVLQWQGTAQQYRILRRNAAGQTEPVVLGETAEPTYLDETAEFDQTYIYSLMSVDGNARSEASEDISYTHRDVFPPAVPAGLRVIAGVGSLELAWSPNSEADLKGYALYRSVEGAPAEQVGAILDLPSYSDRSIEPGKRYAYAVASIDLKGNQSARSPAVEITAPQ